ncbi:cation:proton antiporter [Glycocaulis sp.]|uniref:cation:proton antiporter n=1 Tax=Glycocaulis sp. TaxID=1969725 RepID=UPI003F6E4546
MSAAELSVIFFAQLAVIIAACRAVGWLARRYLGQPQVVGEMIAGIILGPSLFGLFLPEFQAVIFPEESRSILYAGAQLGVGLYMFLVGLGFQSDEFRARARSAAAVSLSGIAAPFLIAVVLTPWLMEVPGLFSDSATRLQASLFMGAAIAITAFPMLARIIHERGLSGTPLGTLSLSSGAIGDAAAWIVLAIVVASFGGGMGAAWITIAGAIAFTVFMVTLAPRLLAPLGRMVEREGKVSHGVLAITLVLFLLAAFAMDAIGIHAVFGGFLLGAVMPRGLFAAEIRRLLEPVAVVLFLPMFFTYSGLHTQLTLVSSPELVLIAIAVLAASVLAKFGACWAAARLTGQDNATALGIGALMNARGLMELIIINIALQAGIIGPALFSILVLMAVVTTLMATPLFEWVYGRKAREAGRLGTLEEGSGTDPVPPEKKQLAE